MWCESWEFDPYMRGLGGAEQENQFLYFLAHERHFRRVVAGTLRGRQSGVKKVFELMQLPFIPGQGKLIKAFLEGASRHDGGAASARKLPVTTCHLRYILKFIRFSRSLDSAVWAACMLGFFFMLRSKNYVAPDGEAYDPAYMLLREDVAFFLDEKDSSRVELSEPTAPYIQRVELTIKKTKTNQRGETYKRTLHRVSDPHMCVVKALIRHLLLTKHYPQDWPMTAFGEMKTPRGRAKRVVSRGLLAKITKAAAKALGDNPADYGSHSFRIGGATALVVAGAQDAYIMNLGTWSSPAYLIYCRMVTNASKYQERMVRQTVVVHKPDGRVARPILRGML